MSKIKKIIAKENVILKGATGKEYEFKKDSVYETITGIMNFSKIGIDDTSVTVNTSWLLENFDFICEG
jgi:hypothetical protein